jgi:hypothetical protein
MSIICVDPGKKAGWAAFEGQKLKLCCLWAYEPLEIHTWSRATHFLVERPVIYPRSKARPRDIITLALLAGRAAAVLGWERVVWVEPRKWKGTIDPDAMTIRIIKALTDEERAIYFAAADKVAESYRHNIADAIGIGLWKLGRLTTQAA